MKTTLGLAVLALLTLTPRLARADEGEDHVKLMEQVGDLIDHDRGDCDKMGTDLGAFFAKHHAEMQAHKEAGAKMTPEQREEFHKKYGDRMQAAEMKLRGGMMACHQNPKVMAAMRQMHPAGGPHPH